MGRAKMTAARQPAAHDPGSNLGLTKQVAAQTDGIERLRGRSVSTCLRTGRARMVCCAKCLVHLWRGR
jgi:hypothetical protein